MNFLSAFRDQTIALFKAVDTVAQVNETRFLKYSDKKYFIRMIYV